MMRETGISLYPEFMQPNALEAYTAQAAACGVTRVFMSMILKNLHFRGAAGPEAESFDRAFARCREYGFDVTVDLNGETAAAMGGALAALSALAARGASCARIDSGMDAHALAALSGNAAGMRIEINASDIDVSTPARRARMEEAFDVLAREGERQNLSAGFNFYPRTGTGLALERVRETLAFLHAHGIKASAFAASLASESILHRQGHGVCTVEAFRDVPPGTAAKALFLEGMDSVYIGDLAASPGELRAMRRAREREEIVLPVVYYPECPKALRAAIADTLLFSRTDTPERVVRATQTRGISVAPARRAERGRYAVTVDNVLSDQYMGEVQIMLCDMPACAEANVAGFLHPDAVPLLPYLRSGAQAFRLYDYADTEEDFLC